MRRLLLVEDEEIILKALTRLLERNRYEVVAVGDIGAAEAAVPDSFDIVLADLRLPGRDGTAVIPMADPVPVVVMTSHASVRSAVEVMRTGASDYIAKPFDHDELLLVLDNALSRNRLSARNRALEHDIARAEPSTARVRDTALHSLVATLLEATDADAPLHLRGAPGSGREDLARELHAGGSRSDGPLVVVDGDDGLIAGLDRARGGTLVLRHPETLPPEALDALVGRLGPPDGATRRPGGAVFRLITLGQGTVVGSAPAERIDFQEHEIPPLEARRADVEPLARGAAERHGRRHAGRPAILSDATVALLGARSRPGGTAALERTIELAVLGALPPGTDPTALADAPAEPFLLPDEAFGSLPDTLDLDAYFRYVVLRLQPELSETDIAARLGMSRKALWERRHRMGLPRPSTGPS